MLPRLPSDDLTGFVDSFNGTSSISGWVLNRRDPSAAVDLFPSGPGSLVSDINRGIFRSDLAKHGDGRFGFNVTLARAVTPMQVLAGAGMIKARSSGTLDFDVPLERSLRIKLLLHVLEDVWIQLSRCQKQVLERQIESKYRASSGSIEAFPLLTSLQNRDQLTHKSESSLTSVLLPTGLRSGCLTAELGRDGHLFLVGGNNKVSESYDRGQSKTDAFRWLELFRRRKRLLEANNIRYVQLIIPEKQTVLSRQDGHKPAPTLLLQQIETEIDQEPTLKDSYVSALAYFRRTDTSMVFRHIDSHLSPFGSRVIYAALAPLLGHDTKEVRIRSTRRIATGDLARRFFGLDLLEIVTEVEEEECVSSKTTVNVSVPNKRHIGRNYRWHNPRASASCRVLAFGNSFMDGALVQDSVSYWLAGNCRDYEFRFSPGIDMNAIEEFRPELVIAQTIERYLHTVPHA